MYQASQQAQAANGGAESTDPGADAGTGGSNDAEDVTDVEYEEVDNK